MAPEMRRNKMQRRAHLDVAGSSGWGREGSGGGLQRLCEICTSWLGGSNVDDEGGIWTSCKFRRCYPRAPGDRFFVHIMYIAFAYPFPLPARDALMLGR